MITETIHVVMQSQGEYSDRTETPIVSFLEEHRAEAYADHMTYLSREAYVLHCSLSGLGPKNPGRPEVVRRFQEAVARMRDYHEDFGDPDDVGSASDAVTYTCCEVRLVRVGTPDDHQRLTGKRAVQV